jgi:hypothetical protein
MLGRCIEHSALLPDAIIAEANPNLLRLRAAVVIPGTTKSMAAYCALAPRISQRSD